MRPTRKNYTQRQHEVNVNFHHDVRQLFIGTYHGTKCTTPLVLRILLLAACSAKSLFHACRSYATFNSHTLANALECLLPQCLHQLERLINEILSSGLPKNFYKKQWRIAIDLVLIPYHGNHQYRIEEVYRSQAKNGTSHFHAYATACIIHKGHRYTVALIPVANKTPMKEVVQTLLQQCRRIGLKCSLLLLDRGFYSVETISYLKSIHQPFLMPLVIRGKKKTKNRPAGGTRRYADSKSQFWDRYELTSVKKVGNDYFMKKTKIDICVYCKNTKGRYKQTGRKAFAYAYYGIKDKSAAWFFETYRTRFGIESSYRQSHQCRIRTSTKSALLRLFYFALSMFLRNLWITFEREMILGGAMGKQKTSRYYAFDDFRNEIRNRDAEHLTILSNNKGHETPVFNG